MRWLPISMSEVSLARCTTRGRLNKLLFFTEFGSVLYTYVKCRNSSFPVFYSALKQTIAACTIKTELHSKGSNGLRWYSIQRARRICDCEVLVVDTHAGRTIHSHQIFICSVVVRDHKAAKEIHRFNVPQNSELHLPGPYHAASPWASTMWLRLHFQPVTSFQVLYLDEEKPQRRNIPGMKRRRERPYVSIKRAAGSAKRACNRMHLLGAGCHLDVVAPKTQF